MLTAEPQVNFQYLRHVVFRYLTDPSHRTQLVPVLTTVFGFTKEEESKISANMSPFRVFTG